MQDQLIYLPPIGVPNADIFLDLGGLGLVTPALHNLAPGCNLNKQILINETILIFCGV